MITLFGNKLKLPKSYLLTMTIGIKTLCRCLPQATKCWCNLIVLMAVSLIKYIFLLMTILAVFTFVAVQNKRQNVPERIVFGQFERPVINVHVIGFFVWKLSLVTKTLRSRFPNKPISKHCQCRSTH